MSEKQLCSGTECLANAMRSAITPESRLHIKNRQLKATNQQLLESLIDAEEKLSILGFYEPEIREAITNAKQQEVN